jgi:hypothetical protein
MKITLGHILGSWGKYGVVQNNVILASSLYSWWQQAPLKCWYISTTLQHIPEDCIHNVHRCENLVSHTVNRLLPRCAHMQPYTLLGYMEFVQSSIFTTFCVMPLGSQLAHICTCEWDKNLFWPYPDHTSSSNVYRHTFDGLLFITTPWWKHFSSSASFTIC